MSGNKRSLNLTIDKKLCTQCGLCVISCIRDAIDIDNFFIDSELCFGCSHCLSVCPVGAIKCDGLTIEKLDEIKIDKEAFKNLIYKRSSHRNYVEKEVPISIINEITELVRFSPTATNSQSVHLTVINNKEKVKEFSDHVMLYFKKLSYFFNIFTFPFFVIFFGYNKAKKFFRYKKQIKRYFDGENILTFDAPSLIFFHTRDNSSSMPADDCNIAATIVNLYLEINKLGACFIGFIVNALKYNKRLKRKIAIPDNHTVYAVLTCGYPTLKFLNKKVRNKQKLNLIN